jgi:predicted TIM-barrel fold metal-dependent hydrolase
MIDAQVHLWEPESKDRPWIDSARGSVHRASFLVADLLAAMTAAGVAKAVLVPPSWVGDWNETCLDAARRFPDRFTVMGRLDVERPLDVEALARWFSVPGMSGIRLTFRRPDDLKQLHEGRADWIWRGADELALPVSIYAPHSTGALGDIARNYPAMRIIVDHLGLDLGFQDAMIKDTVDRLCALAIHPNIAVKATSLPSHVSGGYPFPILRDAVTSVVRAFGAERVFWGSDLTRLTCTYDDLIRFFVEELPNLKPCERELIMGKALEQWLNFPFEAVGTNEGAHPTTSRSGSKPFA